MSKNSNAPPAGNNGPRGNAIALINARLIDPASGRDEPGGLLAENGVIADLGAHLRHHAPGGAEALDCEGHVLAPGLVDMLVYTGEPGHEHRETLATASRAAAAGGVTTIICMPQTKPVIDDVALVDFIERRARDTAVVRVHPMAAITKGLEGEEMTEIGLLRDAGAVAFTDAKFSLANAQVMRRALAYAKDFGALTVHHVEDPKLVNGGVMNEGEISSRLGLAGIPTAAETIVLERDIRLVELTGGRYHAAQITCAASLEVVCKAKARGLPVTCGISVNHLTLNENDVGSYRTFFKIRPPLRSEDDRLAMIEGLVAGDIDVVVSAHDPQDADVKRRPFAEASDGAIGLETLLPAALRLYHNEAIGLAPLLSAMTNRPADLLGLSSGRLKVGAPADLILIDLATPWIVDPDNLHSKSKNTPFDESRLEGRVMRTLVAGRTVYKYGDSDLG